MTDMWFPDTGDLLVARKIVSLGSMQFDIVKGDMILVLSYPQRFVRYPNSSSMQVSYRIEILVVGKGQLKIEWDEGSTMSARGFGLWFERVYDVNERVVAKDRRSDRRENNQH